MSRPPPTVPAPGLATAVSVKLPSGSLAASQVAGGTAEASPLLVAATSAEGVDLQGMAQAQKTCTSVTHLRINSSLHQE